MVMGDPVERHRLAVERLTDVREKLANLVDAWCHDEATANQLLPEWNALWQEHRAATLALAEAEGVSVRLAELRWRDDRSSFACFAPLDPSLPLTAEERAERAQLEAEVREEIQWLRAKTEQMARRIEARKKLRNEPK